jgi:hypothetical protein
MEVIHMTEKQITYYLIEKCRLGKKEDVAYYLFIDAEWVWDEKNVIMDHLMGYDPSEPADSPYAIGNTSIIDEIEEISFDKAMRVINEQTTEFLIDKWKKDLVKEKAEWDKNPGWPAKLVKTEFMLNGIKYIIEPPDIGLTYGCWDQGLMEHFQGNMRKDLEKYGATKIWNEGFID